MRRDLTRDKRFSARSIAAYQAGPTKEGVRIVAAQPDAPAEILIYDVIGADWFGDGVTAKGVLAALADAEGGPVRVRINSPGGDVFEGLAIYNSLKAYPGKVDVVVDGLAASAASVIAMAGETVSMGQGTLLMIHNAATIGIGNRHDMAATAGVLGKIDGQLAEIYAKFSGEDAAGFAAQMDAETWLTAEEAKDAGLATGVIEAPKRPKASVVAEAAVPVVEAADPNDARRRRLRLATA